MWYHWQLTPVCAANNSARNATFPPAATTVRAAEVDTMRGAPSTTVSVKLALAEPHLFEASSWTSKVPSAATRPVMCCVEGSNLKPAGRPETVHALAPVNASERSSTSPKVACTAGSTPNSGARQNTVPASVYCPQLP
ncbi:MAG: hypothetical protein BWX86_01343 [Verrucomicrobia bacterium ADurb.Bin122]|nr:MAG: hypothetical protein BWX86_01343 [Verrucomicrobia bacterium ADurb.Bin122]